LIGRSRIPHGAGCSHRRIMVDVEAESMVGGMIFGRRSPPQVIGVRFPESWSSTFSGNTNGAKNTAGYFCA